MFNLVRKLKQLDENVNDTIKSEMIYSKTLKALLVNAENIKNQEM